MTILEEVMAMLRAPHARRLSFRSVYLSESQIRQVADTAHRPTPMDRWMTPEQWQERVLEEVEAGHLTLFGVTVRRDDAADRPYVDGVVKRLRWNHLAQAWRPAELVYG